MFTRKTYLVKYVYRGSGNRFMSPFQIRVNAANKKDAKTQAIMQVGDIYIVKSVEEV